MKILVIILFLESVESFLSTYFIKNRQVFYSNNKYQGQLLMSQNKYSDQYYKYLVEYKPEKIENYKSEGLGSSFHDNISKLYQSDYDIFEKNLEFISEFNNKKDTDTSIELGLNQFTDSILFNETTIAPDINKLNYLGGINFNMLKKISENTFSTKAELPPYFDWRTKGVLTEVLDQGYCGSCWAFSTCRALETYMRIRNYTITRLSEQELIDCSSKNFGCRGGYMHLAYEYCIENKGLVNYDDYPYKGEEQTCSISCSSCKLNLTKVTGSNISEFSQVIPGSISDMKKSLLHNPISIALDASLPQFRFYKSGVISIPSKNSTELNHAVLLVGYDNDETGEYWIIQNSWGKKWGEDGFANIRIEDGLGSLLCQLYAFYPE